MIQLIYDGSYKGWLTAVFEIYEYKFQDISFCRADLISGVLFASSHDVFTDEAKAMRVLQGLQKRLSTQAILALYQTFLSDISGTEDMMWRFVRYVFASSKNVERDLSNKVVWDVRETANKVRRESHRMKAFVRFKLSGDKLYYAMIEPDHNVLPLVAEHFKQRYADQRWLIYDTRRKYGIYYDLHAVEEVRLHFQEGLSATLNNFDLCDEREELFQALWCRYYKSVNIKARKNMRLHMQHLPRRYWKHLTEKRPLESG